MANRKLQFVSPVPSAEATHSIVASAIDLTFIGNNSGDTAYVIDSGLDAVFSGTYKGNVWSVGVGLVSDSYILSETLTGYVSGAGVVTATDTILQAIQKLNGNTLALVTGVSSVNSLTGTVALTGTTNRITISAANVFDIGTDVVTLTGSQGLSNKTGNISQWTNDSNYITLVSLSAVSPIIYNNATGVVSTSMNTNKLVGRGTAAVGVMEEITLGTGLSFAATTLNVSGFVSSTLTDTHIFVGNTISIATDVAVSGDVTLANTGAFTVTKINGAILGTTTATDKNILVADGVDWDSVAVSGDLTVTNLGAFTIINNAVTYGKMQQASTVTLLGNPTGLTANISEITLGTGLSFSGTTLNASVSSSSSDYKNNFLLGGM
jgi:hypothetical protein